MKRRKNLGLPPETKEIYDQLLNIEVETSSESHYPNQLFKHRFPEGVKVLGLPDGSILIKSDKGEKLWQEFEYDEE